MLQGHVIRAELLLLLFIGHLLCARRALTPPRFTDKDRTPGREAESPVCTQFCVALEAALSLGPGAWASGGALGEVAQEALGAELCAFWSTVTHPILTTRTRSLHAAPEQTPFLPWC